MNLGERIYALRTGKGLSQEALADALEVSRQSISKWENNAAVPELEKLVKMSALFGVTLDELVTGNRGAPTPPPASEPAPAPASPARPAPPHRTAGVVLLCFGALVILLCFLLAGTGGLLGGLIFASPFLLCGVICMNARKNAGLWCAWAVFFAVDVYLRYATGINWGIVRLTFVFEAGMNYVSLAIGWAELLILLTLSIVTVVRFSKKPLKATRKVWVRYGLGWVIFALLHIPVPLAEAVSLGDTRMIAVWRVIGVLGDWCRIALFLSLVITSLRLLRGRKAG